MKEGNDIHRLASENLNYVKHLANQFCGQGVEFEDLVSEGYLAMTEAAQKYDTGRGVPFVAYAAPFIRKAMKEAIEQQTDTFKMPRDIKKTAPRSASKAVSIDAPLSIGNQYTLLDILVNKDALDADEDTMLSQLLADLKTSISKLDEREQEVVRKFYGIDRARITLAEIGEDMGLKRERVRQIRDKATRKMAKYSQTKMLKVFLKK